MTRGDSRARIHCLPADATGGAGSLPGSRSTVSGLIALSLLVVACGSPAGTPPPTIIEPAVADLIAGLRDEVTTLPDGRVAWSTVWKLCWAAYPIAVAYELQARTSEGVGTSLRRQNGPCFEVETARGEHAAAEWRKHREVLLTLSAGQLAYSVRAVLEGNQVSMWSVALPVGLET